MKLLFTTNSTSYFLGEVYISPFLVLSVSPSSRSRRSPSLCPLVSCPRPRRPPHRTARSTAPFASPPGPLHRPVCRATTSAAAAGSELYHVGTREASDAEAAPSLTEKVSSREVAPAAKPEPTPTEATQKNLQGSSSLEADGALRLTSSARKLTVKSKSFWETRENGSKSEQGEPTSSPPADYPPNVTAQSVRSADLPIGSRLKQHRRAAQAHRRRAS